MRPAPSGTTPPRRADADTARFFALARLVEEAGWWVLLIGGIGYGVTAGARPEHVGLVLAAWLLPRLPMFALGRLAHPLLAYGALLTVLVAIAALNRAGLVEGFELILLVVTVVGAARALGAARRTVIIRERFAERRTAIDASEAVVAWLGLAVGAAVAMVMVADPRGDILWLLNGTLIGVSMVVVGAALARATLIGVGKERVHPGSSEPVAVSQPAGGSDPGFLPLRRSRVATHAAAAVAAAALFVAVVAMLPFRAAAVAGDHSLFPAGLLLVALGGLAAQAPPARDVHARLRQRVPPVLVVVGLVAVLSAASAVTGLAGWWLAGALALLVAGIVLAALHHEHVIRVRQLHAGRSALRVLVAAGILGQVAGALAVAALGAQTAALASPLVVVAIVAAVLMAVVLVIDRSSIFALRHQVQQFSWNADPPPRAYEPAPAATRQARLEGWIERQVELELVDVTLPVSGRRYAIARPSGDGRDRLFEEAKADPERQMPYWAKVWPSGVALADVVVERAGEVRDRQVLELGAGLGVTACTVLEEGGRLITADYSLLPLSLCRLNGLANTGRGAGSICFNWRDEEQVREVLRRHPPIGLILAADVLYEGRDVMPLVHVIERLLAPGGSLWLAEPVRRTAHRFLDTVAASGWSIDSRRIRADWPDATDGWVNVHIIQREREPTETALGLGAFQL